jgi:hypothetical protein
MFASVWVMCHPDVCLSDALFTYHAYVARALLSLPCKRSSDRIPTVIEYWYNRVFTGKSGWCGRIFTYRSALLPRERTTLRGPLRDSMHLNEA